MSDDINDAIENPEDLDEETREKLKEALDEEGDQEAGDEQAEEEGESQEAETAEASGDDVEEASDDPEEQGDEQLEASDAEENSEESDGDDQSESESDGAGFRSDPEDAGSLIGGIFNPENYGAVPEEDEEIDGAYLGDGDLESGGMNKTIFMFGVLLVFAFAAGSVGILSYTKQGDRIIHLFKGDLKEYEMAKARQEKRRFEEKQLAQLPQFGTLSLRGYPKYSTLKLDGEVQYGKTPDSGEWRPVILTPETKFQNLDIEEEHTISASAPGHESNEWTLTERMWQQVSGSDVDYQRTLRVNLVPESQARQWEFKERMKKDSENNFFGKVKITTKPEGAKIIFDGKPLLDEEGEPRKTPATFEKAYYEDEESGEIKEKKIKVDMPPDAGHKIQLRMEGEDFPKFVTPLERQMWTCEWKEGEPPEKPPYTKGCNYSYELNLDFNELKSYIEERKKEREKIRKQNEEIQEKVEKVQEKTG